MHGSLLCFFADHRSTLSCSMVCLRVTLVNIALGPLKAAHSKLKNASPSCSVPLALCGWPMGHHHRHLS